MHHEELGQECLRRWHGGSRVPVSLGEGDAGGDGSWCGCDSNLRER